MSIKSREETLSILGMQITGVRNKRGQFCIQLTRAWELIDDSVQDTIEQKKLTERLLNCKASFNPMTREYYVSLGQFQKLLFETNRLGYEGATKLRGLLIDAYLKPDNIEDKERTVEDRVLDKVFSLLAKYSRVIYNK